MLCCKWLWGPAIQWLFVLTRPYNAHSTQAHTRINTHTRTQLNCVYRKSTWIDKVICNCLSLWHAQPVVVVVVWRACCCLPYTMAWMLAELLLLLLLLPLVSYYGYCNFVALNGSAWRSVCLFVWLSVWTWAWTESANAIWGLKFIMKTPTMQRQQQKWNCHSCFSTAIQRESGQGACIGQAEEYLHLGAASGCRSTTKPLVRFKFN